MNRKQIVIIGANSGIGFALAQQFAQLGNDLTLTYRNPGDNQLQSSLAELTKFGSKVNIIQLDITDAHSVQAFSEACNDAPIDALFVVSGKLARGTIEETLADDIAEMVTVNLAGPMYVLKALASKMSQTALIILFSSDAAIYGRPGLVAYSAAKAGLIGLAKAMKADYPSQQIFAAEVGLTCTEMSGYEPSGMDPQYVAQQLYKLYAGELPVPEGTVEVQIGPAFADPVSQPLTVSYAQTQTTA